MWQPISFKGARDLQKVLSDSYVGKWKELMQQLSALMKSWVSNHGKEWPKKPKLFQV